MIWRYDFFQEFEPKNLLNLKTNWDLSNQFRIFLNVKKYHFL